MVSTFPFLISRNDTTLNLTSPCFRFIDIKSHRVPNAVSTEFYIFLTFSPMASHCPHLSVSLGSPPRLNQLCPKALFDLHCSLWTLFFNTIFLLFCAFFYSNICLADKKTHAQKMNVNGGGGGGVACVCASVHRSPYH